MDIKMKPNNRKRRLKSLAHIMRKESWKNLILTKQTVGPRKTTGDILDWLVQMGGRNGFRRKNKIKNITESYKGKEDMEGYDRLRP